MRPFFGLVIYIAVVFIGGALLRRGFGGSHKAARTIFRESPPRRFNRFVDRSFLAFALAGLWPLLRAARRKIAARHGHRPALRPVRKNFSAGWRSDFSRWRSLPECAVGFAWRAFSRQTSAAHKIVGIIFSAIATAVTVATLEEILFRGGIFGGLRRMIYWPFALVISSAIYALVHFLQRAEFTGAVTWRSGFELFPQILRGFVDFHALVPGFFSLTLAGILLGLAYQRTGNLYFSIGLHAGWIFWLKTYGAFTAEAPDATIWFWGSGKMI